LLPNKYLYEIKARETDPKIVIKNIIANLKLITPKYTAINNRVTITRNGIRL